MAFLNNRWATASILLACWALVATLFAAYYRLQYDDVTRRIGGALIYVSVGVDYGNGTRIFSNNSKAFTGTTLFDVTKQAFNVTYQVGPLGTEVLSINGVNKQDSFGWTYWLWNGTVRSWSIVWNGADDYRVANEETFMWYYQNGFNPPP